MSVAYCFNRSYRTYDHASILQQEINQNLLHLLDPYISHSLPMAIDLGCGTGNSTISLAEKWNIEQLIGIDIADKLVDVAKIKSQEGCINFILSDFEKPHPLIKKANLIYSNMALHWGSCLSKTIQIICDQLDGNALLACSFPVFGTLREISLDHRNSFEFYDKVLTYFPGNMRKLYSCSEGYSVNFPTAYEALKSLKQTGSNQLFKHRNLQYLKKSQLLQSAFGEEIDDSKTLSYQIGFFIFQKVSR